MSETTRLLDDALDRLLTRRLSDAMARNAPGLAESLAAEIINAGFTRVLATQESGGLNGTLGDAAVVAWRCGWHAAPLPIVEMLLLPCVDPGADPARVSVAHGNPATAPLISGIEKIATARNRAVSADTARPFLALSGAQCGVLDGAATHDDRLRAMGALLTTAAMTGAMARVIEIVTDHARTRTQFGRPLTKFQAIQHHLAQAMSELTITEAALTGALESYDTLSDAGRADSLLWLSAKAQAGVAATAIASSAHQILGAIGFTREHELHHFTTRLWQWRDEWGRQSACDLEIGRAACAPARGLWEFIADGESDTA